MATISRSPIPHNNQKRHRAHDFGHAVPCLPKGGGLVTDQARYLDHRGVKRLLRIVNPGPRTTRVGRKRRSRFTKRDPDERDDGRDPAFDPSNSLPGEQHYRRTPRLVREEAFRAPKACEIVDVVVDDAELYRMGILYDQDANNNNCHCQDIETEHGADFSFDAIVHPEPAYSLSLRAATRLGKSRVGKEGFRQDACYGCEERPSPVLSGCEVHLPVHLDENAATQRPFAHMATEEENAHGGDTDIQHRQRGRDNSPGIETDAQPLSVAYKLIESSKTPPDFLLTQLMASKRDVPPDLMPDDDGYESGSEVAASDWDIIGHPEPIAPDIPEGNDTYLGDIAAAFGDDDYYGDDDGLGVLLVQTVTADDAWVVIAGDDS
ncbi:hypothetical protein F5Y17DRAFT_21324 [Xylariaceae sp. FL0594]|nr:hypothetical protein F5Y17DRAFT_21324 [Xylariaceae sp. FL0594]